MESSILLPITFWNNSKPTFRVSSICISPNGRKLVTSSPDGTLSIWDLSSREPRITPRNLIIGHSDPVTCVECGNDYAISASLGGEICRWNLDDGRCSKSITSVYIHRRLQLFRCSNTEFDVLFTCGDYHEIFIIHSVLLHTLLVLHSKSDSDWISCFHVISSLEIGHDVVSAVTQTSHIKLWIIEEISDNFSYEVQSSFLPVKNVSHIKTSLTQTQILTVCDNSWSVFDAKHLKKICTADRICNEKFLGGDFFDSDILTWTNECRFYLYKLGVDGASLKMVFKTEVEPHSLFLPAMYYFNSHKERYLVYCSISGKLVLWKPNDDSKPNLICDLNSMHEEIKTDNREYLKEVTCCVMINKLELFVVGFSNGSIIVMSALQTIFSRPEQTSEDFEYKTLLGHKGKVNCLLYPHETHLHHDKNHLLSGGSDFSVCLWDLHKRRLIHKFCVQSGEIIKLLIPPEECKPRIRNSVCSVANDHSVAILNLKELKCIVLASRQLFPVVTINWRPLDDFIIIECFDGTVYIWEMETGHLDRVLHGVTAQEVIYACKESNHDDATNFYLREDGLVGKDHFQRGLFQIEKDFHVDISVPIVVRGFLTSFQSENQIVAFNVASILELMDGNNKEGIDWELFHKVEALTCPTTAAAKNPEQVDRSVSASMPARDLGKFLLGTLQNWPDFAPYAVFSDSHNVSILFSSSLKTPVLNTIRTVTEIALSSILNVDMKEFDISECEMDVEILARAWLNESVLLRKVARKILLSILRSQSVSERAALLERWFKYLPHFTKCDGLKISKIDVEIVGRQAVALVLFGVIGVEYKFKIDDAVLEEKYLAETCAALLYLLQCKDPQRMGLQSLAVNILGYGYGVWEQHLKFDKIFHYLFEMTSDIGKSCNGDPTPSARKCVNVHDALVSISIARTTAFISCLVKEIAHVRNSQNPKTETYSLDRSKTGILLILSNLMERTPYIMMQHLNDAVTILTYCLSPTHLKQEVIGRLVPAVDRFKQVHQCLTSQRIAVGLHDGSVVIHELKTLKTHKIAAHSDSVSAVMFSPDGKVLATYCYFENRLCFWHVFSSMFGLGHVHLKCIKTYETNKIKDESVRNHLEVGDFSWTDTKSVVLRLCDGTQTVYHV